MPITPISSAAADANTLALPTHAVGDVLLMFAQRTGSNTVPVQPAAGGTVPTWTSIGSAGANTHSSRVSWTKATAANHTSGTWTNATQLICLVARGVLTPLASAVTQAAANTQTIVYPALAVTKPTGDVWLLRFGGRGAANADVPDPPAGWTFRQADVNNFASAHTLGPGDVDAVQQTVSLAGASNASYRAWTVELLPAPVLETVTCQLDQVCAPGNHARMRLFLGGSPIDSRQIHWEQLRDDRPSNDQLKEALWVLAYEEMFRSGVTSRAGVLFKAAEVSITMTY